MKKTVFIFVAVFATMFATAQNVFQNKWVSVTVNNADYGTVTVINPVIGYDTVGDIVDTIKNCRQWLFIPMERDSSIRFNCFVAEIFGDSNYIDTLFDSFYFFDILEHDSLALHAYFYDLRFGTPEIDDGEVFMIYPNPTSSVVRFNRYVRGPVYMFGPNGRLIATFVNTDKVDMGKFPNGMYVIRANSYACRLIKL